MSTIQQDLIYEEFEIKQRIQQHNDNEKNRTPSSTVKRHPTNHSQLNDDQYTVEYQDDDMEFQEINYNRQRKKRINKDKDQRIHARMIINSNINNNRNSQATTTTNDNIIKGDSVRISKHALDYASEYHHQPFKIECDPKLKDQREGSKFIQAIINYIKIDFYKQNVSYNKQLLFDLWWIDKEGNIRAIVKYTEIAVYLSQVNRHPTEIKKYKNNTTSTKPSSTSTYSNIEMAAVYVPPKNLPPFELFQAHDNENIIIFGDFNAKHQEWDCEKNNLSVNRIKEWIENEGWHILYPSKPTSKKSKSIIDFAIGQDINGWNAETLDEATPCQLAFVSQLLSVGSRPISVAVGDFNLDRNPDAVVANSGDNTVTVLLGNGINDTIRQGSFPTGANPQSVAVGDFNLDGNPDVVVANSGDNTVTVLLGNSANNTILQGSFPTGANPQSVAVADFNLDGNPDVVVANWGDNTVTVLLGDGINNTIGQRSFPTGANPQSVAIGDFNLDRNPDVVVANSGDNTVTVLLGNGVNDTIWQGSFPTGTNPQSVAVGDFNLDGNPDVVVANSGDNTVTVLFGDGIVSTFVASMFDIAPLEPHICWN
ncbi:unnamed protein product [Rotaria sp. Silwood1]|nr:unnamed protein product [Rotaria sp. Silwood1]